jgi:uncharacterized membrane protein YtjA (UPF0391 family)
MLMPVEARASMSALRMIDPQTQKGIPMLSWAITFLIIALLAGLFGFGLVTGVAYQAAQICFFVFLVLAVISLLTGRRVDA